MTDLEDALGEIDVLAATDTNANPAKSALDEKINKHFAGAVVRLGVLAGSVRGLR